MYASLSKNIKATLVTSFLGSLIYSCTIPFLIIYLAGIYSQKWTGLIVMVNVISAFTAGIVGGYLADTFQRKRILFIFQTSYGLSLLLIAAKFAGILTADFWLVIGYWICGISFNLYSPAFDAVLMDSTTPVDRKTVYQMQYWAFNLSMALGFSIGGFLFKHFLLHLFLFTGILQLLLALSFQKKLDYNNHVSAQLHKNPLKDLLLNYRIAAKDKRWVLLILGMALFNAAEFSLKNYTGVRLSQEFEAITLFSIPIDGVRMLSILQVINTILVVCFTFLISKLTEKKSERGAILYGLVLYVIGYGLIAVFNSIYILVPLMILATIGELASSPNINARKVDLIPENKQASYLAFSSLSYQGAELLAALGLTLGGYISAGVIGAYIIILGLLGTWFVIVSLYGKKGTPSS